MPCAVVHPLRKHGLAAVEKDEGQATGSTFSKLVPVAALKGGAGNDDRLPARQPLSDRSEPRPAVVVGERNPSDIFLMFSGGWSASPSMKG